jgi:mono/diheme cytochrome c family protein
MNPRRTFGSRLLAALALFFLPLSAFAQDSKPGPLTVEQAKKLKNPQAYSKKSIATGRNAFVRMCAGCHGLDGKAAMDVVADATDLTDTKTWKNGTSDGEMFRSIRDGQGQSMPAFKTQVRDEADLWHMVNFIRSLWPESTRPALVEDPKTK